MKEKQTEIAKELEKLVRISKKGLDAKELTLKASAGMGEEATNAAQAYYLTRPEILRDIITPKWAEGTIYEQCNKFDVSSKANGCFLVTSNQTQRTTAAGILGGFIAYNVDEGVPVTFSKCKFAQDELQLHQKGVICRATNALLQDSLVLSEYLSNGFEETLRYYVDYEILYGTEQSTGQGCNGILADGDRATKYVNISTPIDITSLKTMMHFYYGGKNGCWVMSYDIWLEVVDQYANTLPLKFHDDNSVSLFGYPVIVKDNMGSRNIVLGDFTQYFFAQKPMREDMSEHLYYSSNETAFRTIFRINGMPSWVNGITTNDGAVVWPFVSSSNADLRSSSSSSSTDLSESSDSSGSTGSSQSKSSISSQSSKSLSSQSLSSQSSQSLSSQSLSSQSSESLSSDTSSSSSTELKSSSSSKSLSSQSSQSLSSDTSSSSSDNVDGCKTHYCASSFTTVLANGTYTWTGATYNSHPVWNNGTYNIWFDTDTGYYAMSATVGAPENQWISSIETPAHCPVGSWLLENGTLVDGIC